MKATEEQKTTHFGYQEVPIAEKANKVKQIFDTVAENYDIMNDLMSFGLHRLWKLITTELSCVKVGQTVLDLAAGTGDLARRFAKKVGPQGRVILSDINSNMLSVGRDRLINAGIIENVDYILADAQYLPYADNSFHCISMAFGLRNVTDKQLALHSLARCLKPGGQCLILEFSHPQLPGLQPLYDFYSFKVIPKIGKLIASSTTSYQYLVESIRKHPDQQQLRQMMLQAGFNKVSVRNFAGGIVALHCGVKY